MTSAGRLNSTERAASRAAQIATEPPVRWLLGIDEQGHVVCGPFAGLEQAAQAMKRLPIRWGLVVDDRGRHLWTKLPPGRPYDPERIERILERWRGLGMAVVA